MPLYHYRAITEDGRVVEGEGEFASLNDLTLKLSSQNLILISAKEVKEKDKERGKGISISFKISLPFGGVSYRDWSLITRQLSVLIASGVPIVEALELIAEQVSNKKLKEALLEVSKEIEEGSSFHAALEKRRDIFPEFIINMVAVGEETGELDLVLRRTSEYYEKLAFIKGKIKSASYYPTFVLLFATIIVWGILTFVVPKFADIYRSFGAELPLPTQILLNVSRALQENLPYILSFIVVFAFIFTTFYKNSYTFRKAVHNLLIRIPKFGDIFLKSNYALFARTFSTLYTSGVSIDRAIDITARVVGLVPLKEALEEAKEDVLSGKALWASLQKTNMFPRMVIAMIRVGEETGNLDEMLSSIANFYEEEVDRAVEGLISLIEPLLIVFLGTIVGGILIALYLPIFKIGELIAR
ncbi:type II secretion system F family protein [Aquifex pyrophilus]